MTSNTLLRAARRTFIAGAAALMVGALAVPAFVTPTMAADGPASVADLAEGLLGAVVNISTSQTVKGTEGPGAVPMPQLPEGSPFQDFFDDFFKNRGGDKDGGSPLRFRHRALLLTSSGWMKAVGRTALITLRAQKQSDSRWLCEKQILLQCTCKIDRTV